MGHGAGCLASYGPRLGNHQRLSMPPAVRSACGILCVAAGSEPATAAQLLVPELGSLGLSNKELQLVVCERLLVGVEGCERG